MSTRVLWTRSHLDSRAVNDAPPAHLDVSCGSLIDFPEVTNLQAAVHEPTEPAVPRDVVFLPQHSTTCLAVSAQLDQADPNTSNGCIQGFEADGTLISGLSNINVAGLTTTVDRHLAFVVTEYGSDRVEVRDVTARGWPLVRTWADGRCATVSGLDQDRTGMWALSDTKHHVISLHNEDGSPVISFGNWGDRKPQFNTPNYVIFDPVHRGRIIVADTGNKRVKFHDLQGKSLHSFRAEELQAPGGLAVDPRTGHVYVADMAGNGVYRYSADGEYTGQKILFYPEAEDSVTRPVGVAIDAAGRHLAVVGCYPLNVLSVMKIHPELDTAEDST